ncbi:MAG: hypothetical protein K0Q60_3982 [Microvirga sp.]|jgi:hypothetical protein|nr:hypothetical protein [Microvirga sp.]
MGRRFVSYLRVSTSKQGALGLGIEARAQSGRGLPERRQLEAPLPPRSGLTLSRNPHPQHWTRRPRPPPAQVR